MFPKGKCPGAPYRKGNSVLREKDLSVYELIFGSTWKKTTIDPVAKKIKVRAPVKFKKSTLSSALREHCFDHNCHDEYGVSSKDECEISDCDDGFFTILTEKGTEKISTFYAKRLESIQGFDDAYFTESTIRTLKDEGYLGWRKRESRRSWD